MAEQPFLPVEIKEANHSLGKGQLIEESILTGAIIAMLRRVTIA